MSVCLCVKESEIKVTNKHITNDLEIRDLKLENIEKWINELNNYKIKHNTSERKQETVRDTHSDQKRIFLRVSKLGNQIGEN